MNFMMNVLPQINKEYGIAKQIKHQRAHLPFLHGTTVAVAHLAGMSLLNPYPFQVGTDSEL
jgi:hypothetical protein